VSDLALGLRNADAEAEMPDDASRFRPDYPRVMMVDDDPALLEAMAEWLVARCGAKVTTFTSAEEVMASSRPDSFDVCILDYRLEGANGLTLGAMLREINPNAQLILVSGWINSTIESLAIEHGFGRVLTKPFSLEKLASVIIT
jgi:DNA-binding NtrC family response regulator